MWILRFNNGVISSGISLNEEGRRLHRADELSAEELWSNVLNAYPSLKEMFEDAEPLQPWRKLDPLSYCTKTIAGNSGSKMWTLLPSAASFVDPLLSTGFPLTLLGIERLARIAKMARKPKDSSSEWVSVIQEHLFEYQNQTLRESKNTAALVGAMISNLDDFEIFKNLSRFYFVAASYTETMRRLKRPQLAPGFLLCNDQQYVSNMTGFIESLREPIKSTVNPSRWIEILKSYDVMGMTDMSRGSRYPVIAEDLLNASERIGIDRPELDSLLRNLGM
jgi:FADH2 O2-dependent halogenase